MNSQEVRRMAYVVERLANEIRSHHALVFYRLPNVKSNEGHHNATMEVLRRSEATLNRLNDAVEEIRFLGVACNNAEGFEPNDNDL